MGTYSIVYYENGVEKAIDWNWMVKNQWARSEKEGLGGKWIVIPGLDDTSYKILLNHFGLDPWQKDFPLAKVLKKGPKELALERRKKEAKLLLPRKIIKSYTMGYHIEADNYL